MNVVKQLLPWVLLALLGFGLHPAKAAECNPLITVASHHFDRSIKRNERNWGLGVECGRLRLGEYKNSEWGHTTYLLYDYPLFHSRYFGILGGVVMGYDYMPVMPMAALSIRYSVLRFTVVPPVKANNGVPQGVIGLQVVIPL